MKTISKKSIITGLKYTMDLALVLQLVGIIVVIVSITVLSMKNSSDIIGNKDSTNATLSSPVNNVMIVLSNPGLGDNINNIENKFLIFCYGCAIINVIALILVTLQLRTIFKSFCQEDYFNSFNSKRIRRIAIIIFIWVIFDYVLRFIPMSFIPYYFISSSVGINTFRNGVVLGMFGFNIKMLITSIIIYIISIVFKYGNILKEESALTI